MPLLYVTDLAYPARGRRYCDEDIFLTSRLRADFELALCHPADAEVLLPLGFDAVIVRNSGPVLHYQEAYDSFRAAALAAGTPVYNPLTGRGDMAGKQYLLDLTAAGYPVIPTIDDPARLAELPQVPQYAVKPKQGADSIGLTFTATPDGPAGAVLIQPRIDFTYEVSFYFVDDAFQYALHAPDPSRRWELEAYAPTEADLAFARAFIAWNTLEHGIQRVDACRAPSGELLLVELEDLNPYLSLDLLPAEVQNTFVAALTRSLRSFID
ncbi:hypothetical protein PV721_04760 [Streptomyces sp. MB09-01]|uniref:hypothetical protein n=1 Tax=Streptomyces sp. MB09-01 TaxID=3028666 RepID=UPI00299FA47F|nr:hypothetical protein [Streptomyces sp. MB09-01]MDX3533686.1 hypothetical protein [Streptomyces sp. MB09-01]